MGQIIHGKRGGRIRILSWYLTCHWKRPRNSIFFPYFVLFFPSNSQTRGPNRGGSETLNFPCLRHSVFLAGPSKCEVERDTALRFQHPFVPSCAANGGYKPVQCHQQGQCWCVDTQGQQVPGTSRRGQPPACGMYEICQRKKWAHLSVSLEGNNRPTAFLVLKDSGVQRSWNLPTVKSHILISY